MLKKCSSNTLAVKEVSGLVKKLRIFYLIICSITALISLSEQSIQVPLGDIAPTPEIATFTSSLKNDLMPIIAAKIMIIAATEFLKYMMICTDSVLQ